MTDEILNKIGVAPHSASIATGDTVKKTLILCVGIAMCVLTGTARADSIDWTQGFSTDYAARVAGMNSMWDPGTYTFDSSALNNHALWETGGDATGDGLFMLVNGVEDSAHSLVWGKSLDLGGNPFVVFAKNLCCIDKPGRPGPELEFWFDGFKISDIITDGAGRWDLFSFIPPVLRGTHEYEIRNGSTVFDGNDFGLDFNPSTPTPEPLTIVTLGSGLFMIAKGLRGKRSRA